MSNTRKAQSVDAILAKAALPERTVPHCVRGDLVAEVERLERELAQAQTKDARLTGNTQAREIAERIEAVRAEMQDSVVEFTLRAMPKRAFQKFLVDHAPREDNAQDRLLGYNSETLTDDLVLASLASPELTDEQWEKLCDCMTAAQWNEFVEAANALNMQGVSVPFSLSASRILRASDES